MLKKIIEKTEPKKPNRSHAMTMQKKKKPKPKKNPNQKKTKPKMQNLRLFFVLN
jgi:hypothetical protein